MITEKTTCRLCNSPVKPVFALTPTPIANAYADKPDSNADRYPLELTECTECNHVQQRYLISDLFRDYKYTTPATVARYLDPTAKLIKERFPDAKTVLEIGSNNGTYLKVLRENGFGAMGIDPAATGVNNHIGYFNERWANNFYFEFGKTFNLIIANNVLAHIDDLQDVFRGINHLLADDGALIFEVQYFPDLVKEAAFDMIYHEHMSYHTVEPLKAFVKKFGLVITNVDHMPLHGGSIRVTARRSGNETVFQEDSIDWDDFKKRVEETRERIREKVKGKKMIAFGAAAKATTMIHHTGIAENIIYCVDDTPEKQFRYIPGTDIRILPTSNAKNGDTIFCFAWNYLSEIREMFPNSILIHPFKP